MKFQEYENVIKTSKWNDLNIPLEKLFESNELCRFSEEFNDIKDTDGCKPYVIYLRHPGSDSDERSIGIAMGTDGFVYVYDSSEPLDLPLVKTEYAVKLMMEYLKLLQETENFISNCCKYEFISKYPNIKFM